ncbi:hypothetical protein JG687_00012326 [Phytophthora cactorum]|uniref:Uncharacterized protein n=1 Tax=Phytophthora cactorum TaxID=29920 RepID=A0A8T1U3F8_9STRA|nr:hypothetical protein JG687_00012326 [Phytophthora cactorum]
MLEYITHRSLRLQTGYTSVSFQRSKTIRHSLSMLWLTCRSRPIFFRSYEVVSIHRFAHTHIILELTREYQLRCYQLKYRLRELWV